MNRTQCPELVGRDEECHRLRVHVRDASEGLGSMVLVAGEAGVGKSRLVHELAGDAARDGYVVLRGSAVERSGTALRPLVEVVLAAFDAGLSLSSPELEPLQPILGPLVGGRHEPRREPPSVLLAAEGVRRVLMALSSEDPLHVVVEDLHWADDDTLEALEFLADHLGDSRVLLVATVRTGDSHVGSAIVERLGRRADVIPLQPLADAAVRSMVAIMGNPSSMDDLADLVVANADGIPLFVEELVAGALAHSSDAVDEWHASRRYHLRVPAAFARSVRQRVDGLGPRGAEILAAAAMIGRDIDVDLLTSTFDADADDVMAILIAARDVGLIDSPVPGALRFRHALTRDAVHNGVFAPERRRLARLCAESARSLHPQLEGEWCSLVAGLLLEAGDAHQASTLFLESARRATEAGALSTAEALVEEALRATGDDLVLAAALQQQRLEILALQGRCDALFEHVPEVLRALHAVGAPPSSLAAVHLRAARGAVLAERWSDAARELAAVLEAGGSDDSSTACEAEVLHAHIDLALGNVGGAVRRADRALDVAIGLGFAEMQCDALEVVGRVHRMSDLEAASAAFERGLAVATAHGLQLWRARALHEVATVEVFRTCRVQTMHRAFDEAQRAGALRLACAIESQLASVYITRFEPDHALVHAERSARDAALLGAATSFTTAQLAIVHALRNDAPSLHACAADASASSGGDPIVRAVTAGMAEAMWSLLNERRNDACRLLDEAMGLAEQHPGVPPAMFGPLWATLRSLRGIDGSDAIRTASEPGVVMVRVNEGLLGYAAAIDSGTRGDADGAQRAFDAAEEVFDALEASEGWRHLGRRLAAEGAIRDRWGAPAEWLPATAAYWTASPFPAVAAACAELLRRASGGRRRGRGDSEVPDTLEAFGLTSREVDVLRFVAAGMSNKDIGHQLHLSPRTVASHVSRMLDKLSLERRGQLAGAAFSSGLEIPERPHRA